MQAVLPLSNIVLEDNLLEIDFVKTYQYKCNNNIILTSNNIFFYYNIIMHDSVGLFNWNYFDKLLGDKDIYKIKQNSNLYSTSIGPACIYSDIIDSVYRSRSPLLSSNELQDVATKRLKILKQYFSIISLENTAYRYNPAYSFITDSNFIANLLYYNSAFFTLDIAHALITARNKAMSIKAYLDRLPLYKCIEVHLSKPLGTEDSHELPDVEIMKLFEYVQPKILKDAYIIVEYYKDRNKLKDFYNNVLRSYL